jgi:glycosyltransferase involved in cell wall biosynthesis
MTSCASSEESPTDTWEPHRLAVDTGATGVRSTAERPLVTAVITTYKRSREAKRAIESVLAQTYEPLECIVVEDGSESGLEEWLRTSEYDEIRYVRHDSNQGLAGARNTGIALASGEYVAFLDDDDAWKSERVRRQVDLVRKAESYERLGVVYCEAEVRARGRVVSILPAENEGDLRRAITENGPSTVQSSFLFSKQALLTVGGFDETLHSSIDHDIWLALAAHGFAAKTVSEPLVISYNEFNDSMMTNTSSRIIGIHQFVDKWRPTYHEWFGPEDGERRLERYFARVVGRLAATNVVTGQWRDAAEAVREIYDMSDYTRYNTRVLIYLLGESTVKRFFPPVLIRGLSKIHHTF